MNYLKLFNNAKWIVFCKIVQSAIQLIIGMFSARFLGPSNYGLISYAASVIAFVMPLMKLGFDSTLVHELVESPEKEGEIVGTSLTLNLISGFVCIGFVTAFTTVFNAGETETIIVCLLYSFSLVFSALEMIQYWFQYKLLSKYSSLVMLCSYCIVSAYKIFLLITEKSVYWFALCNSLEFLVIAVSLIIIYLRMDGKLRFSFSIGKNMLLKSKHYILSSMMLVLIQNTDHIMLTSYLGTKENGYYSAAITCSSIAQFVYLAVIDSFRPVILENKKKNESEYKLNISRLYSLTLYLSFIQSLFFTFFSELIIGILYGPDYNESATVLKILIWYFGFSVMGVVRNVWILAEQKQKYLWIINLSGALFNIILNAFFIPHCGACGAAFASLLTQFFANFVLGFIIKPIRENNKLLLTGLNPVFVIKESKNLLILLKKSFNKKISS